MPHIGILVTEAAGHLFSIGALGNELQRRGHQVTVLAGSKAAATMEQLGLHRHELPQGNRRKYHVSRSAWWKPKLRRNRTAQAMRTAMCYWADRQFRFAPDAIRELSVDGLLVDQVQWAGATVAEHLGLPFVTVSTSIPSNEEVGIPPLATPWSYSDSRWARMRNRWGYGRKRRYSRPLLRILNRQRNDWGLRPLSCVNDSLSPLAQLSQLCPEIDFPRRDLPATFHYVGSLAANRSVPDDDFPWHRLDGRPLIFASLGTVQLRRNAKVLPRIAAACDGLNAQPVISLGIWSDAPNVLRESTRSLPGDPIVVDFAPQLALLDRASIMITHAGLNTVLESLGRGVPMVALPRNGDQRGMGSRIEYARVGLRASFRHSTPQQLRSLIERVLNEEEFRQQARKLKEAVSAAGGVQHAADIAEQALITGRPVIREHA